MFVYRSSKAACLDISSFLEGLLSFLLLAFRTRLSYGEVVVHSVSMIQSTKLAQAAPCRCVAALSTLSPAPAYTPGHVVDSSHTLGVCVCV